MFGLMSFNVVISLAMLAEAIVVSEDEYAAMCWESLAL